MSLFPVWKQQLVRKFFWKTKYLILNLFLGVDRLWSEPFLFLHLSSLILGKDVILLSLYFVRILCNDPVKIEHRVYSWMNSDHVEFNHVVWVITFSILFVGHYDIFLNQFLYFRAYTYEFFSVLFRNHGEALLSCVKNHTEEMTTKFCLFKIFACYIFGGQR